MGDRSPLGTLTRRSLLLAAAASCVPVKGRAAGICTPYELAQRYREQVDLRLELPADQVRQYGGALEEELIDDEGALRAPQYLLVVDSNPNVQAAFLFWRLMAGHHQLIGASPVSTAGPVPPSRLECARGLYDQASPPEPAGQGPGRVYQFRSRRAGGPPRSDRRLQARAADAQSARLLGSAQSDGCILLPASLAAFLDDYGVLDAAADRALPERAGSPALPYRGRYMLVMDSDRDERPAWSPCPLAAGSAPPGAAQA